MSNATQENRRAPFPEGTMPVGLALLIAGLATFAFFRVGKSALGGDEEFRPIQAMWFATFALAPGFFLPLEQEMGRALSHRRARGEGSRPVAAKVLRLGIGITTIVTIAIFAFSPLITDAYFDGNWWMLLALATAFVAYAPAHLARGICSGSNRFRAYAVVIASDGVIRIVVCSVFAAAGIRNEVPYAFAVALSPLVAVIAVGLKGQLDTDPGPEAPWGEVTQNLGWLLLGTVFSACLLNAGPVAAELLGDTSDKGQITQFGYGVLIARIPLFMFQAVQAALLPRLARLAAKGEFHEFRQGFRTLMTLVIGVGMVGTLGAFLIGPFVVETMYDVENFSGRTLAMLALSSSLYMIALATSQAVVALHGHGLVAIGWVCAVAAFFLGTWLSSDLLFRRIEYGLVLSSLTAVVCFAVALRARLADGVGALVSGEPAGPLPELPLDA